MRVTINISATAAADLIQLGRTSAIACAINTPNAEILARVLTHLVASASQGVQRGGSWERGWIEQAFGELIRRAPAQNRDGMKPTPRQLPPRDLARRLFPFLTPRTGKSVAGSQPTVEERADAPAARDTLAPPLAPALRLASVGPGPPPRPPAQPLSPWAAAVEAILRPAPLPRRVVQKIKAHMAEVRLKGGGSAWRKPVIKT